MTHVAAHCITLSVMQLEEEQACSAALADFGLVAAQLQQWVVAALEEEAACEVSVRIVDLEEGAALNQQWRGQDHATNVLSFPACMPDGPQPKPLGDVVLCAPVVMQEALAQAKVPAHHWAHLLVHGVLHLRGYDHQNDRDAAQMEAKEVVILDRLGVDDPYRSERHEVPA